MNNPLGKVDGHHRFWVHKGAVVSSLKELPGVLRKMNAESFKHHVNKDKNDFSNWINDVIGDAKLAGEIRKLKTKASIVKKVQSRVKALKKK